MQELRPSDFSHMLAPDHPARKSCRSSKCNAVKLLAGGPRPPRSMTAVMGLPWRVRGSQWGRRPLASSTERPHLEFLQILQDRQRPQVAGQLDLPDHHRTHRVQRAALQLDRTGRVHRSRSMCAAIFGSRWRVKTPFRFMPPIRFTDCTAWKSAKFHTCRPITNGLAAATSR